MRGRDPERADDRVPDELLDGAAVPFDRDAHRVEVSIKDPLEDLGVRTLSEFR
jgi:hypothetical protein